MRDFHYEYMVDGKPLLVADADVQITVYDVESGDSGKDESKVIHRKLAQKKMRQHIFSFFHATEADYKYLETLLLGKSSFIFSYRKAGGSIRKATGYCEKVSGYLHDSKRQIYKKVKFTIEECEGE